MPRGENPKSRANLKKGKPFDAETARKAKEKSDKAKAVYRSLNEDLKECCTPERVRKMNKRIIAMAEHGNLRAYELIRDGLGEKPQNRVQLSSQQDDMAKMEEILKQMGMTDEQSGTVPEV